MKLVNRLKRHPLLQALLLSLGLLTLPALADAIRHESGEARAAVHSLARG